MTLNEYDEYEKNGRVLTWWHLGIGDESMLVDMLLRPDFERGVITDVPNSIGRLGTTIIIYHKPPSSTG